MDLEYRTKELGKVFQIINLFELYSDMKPFWVILKDQGPMEGDNIIISR
jgi:hypothetical protein